MSRWFEDDEQQSNQTQNAVGPIRWMAPESIREKEYSRMSDCWMYGVMLHEIFTQSQPFKGKTIFEVVELVRDNEEHVDIPYNAPPVIQSIMEGVFKQDPSDRLTMNDIVDMLNKEIN